MSSGGNGVTILTKFELAFINWLHNTLPTVIATLLLSLLSPQPDGSPFSNSEFQLSGFSVSDRRIAKETISHLPTPIPFTGIMAT